jgi:putative transposase
VSTATPSYKGHRYPVEIINHCVWLYFRFPLSFREVEELLLVRGVAVSYETIRRWCAKFGRAYANQLRRRRSCGGDKWHLDEVFVGINGMLRYLWRAGRPARQRARRSRPVTPKRGGGQAILP